MLLHYLMALKGLLPDVVWLMILYVVLLDLLKVVLTLETSGIKAVLNPGFWVATLAEDVTAQHAVQLAVSGFIAGLYVGQSWQAAAFGAIAGAATASVADEREQFIAELKKVFRISPPAPKPAVLKV